MADAVRLMSIRKGYDPREFALVVFGGAGPLHGADLARELGIPTVIVPPNPGVTSALGCLLVDVRHDFSEMFGGRAADVDPGEVEDAFARLEAEARERLEAEGIPEDRMTLRRTIDMRYVGQWRSLAIEVEGPVEGLDDAVEAFHREHEREHAYRRDDTPVEIYQINLQAVGETRRPSCPATSATATGRRRAARARCASPARASRSRRRCTSAARCPPAHGSTGPRSSTSSTRRSWCRPACAARWTSG
jgi:N-methylhydantoinase A